MRKREPGVVFIPTLLALVLSVVLLDSVASRHVFILPSLAVSSQQREDHTAEWSMESWDISILVPSRGIVPPHHRLTVTSSFPSPHSKRTPTPSPYAHTVDESDTNSGDGGILVQITPISYNALQRVLFRLGALIGYTQPFQFDAFFNTASALVPPGKEMGQQEPSGQTTSTGLCPILTDWASTSFTGYWKTRAIEGVPDGIYAMGCEKPFLPLALTLLQNRQMLRLDFPLPLYTSPAATASTLERNNSANEMSRRMDTSACAPLPWNATGARSIRLSEDRWVLVLDFDIPAAAEVQATESSKERNMAPRKEEEPPTSNTPPPPTTRCYIPLEGIRYDVRDSSFSRSRLSSYLAPLLLIVLLSGLRSKFVQRKAQKALVGQTTSTVIGTPSARGGPPVLTKERREQLLRQQDELIRQMKEEDKREGRLYQKSGSE